MSGLPKEHGGTVMAAGSLLAGWGFAGSVRPAVVGMILAVAGIFLVREPLTLLVRKRGRLAPAVRRDGLRTVAVALALGVLGGVLSLLALPWGDLLILGAAGALLFGIAFWAGVRQQDRQLWAETLGVAAAALGAPATYLAATGDLDRDAWRLYTVCLLFFLGAMLHLRGLLRGRKAQRRGEPARPQRAALWSLGSAALAAGLWGAGWLPWGLAAAAAVALLRPVVMRGAVLERPQRIGIAESVLTLLFVIAAAALPA